MPGLNKLVDSVRAKYPGAYDDMDDATLTKQLLSKYPEYSDLAAPPAAGNPSGFPMNTVAAIPLTDKTGDQALQEGIDADKKANLSPMDTMKYSGEAVGMGAAAAGAALAAPTVLPAAGKFVLAHPVATAMAVHIGRELGVPIPKVLDVLKKFGGE